MKKSQTRLGDGRRPRPSRPPSERLPALPGRGVAVALALACSFAFVLWPVSVCAESASEAQLRAAYLVNFLKYVEWPVGVGGATICIYGRDSLTGPLAAYEGRTIQGREVRIRRISQPEQLADCQEVFVPEADEERYAGLFRSVGRLPVLTVGESPAFVQQGGGVALVRVENRLVFDVNLGAITRSGLRVSPQMLRLAREVVGAPR